MDEKDTRFDIPNNFVFDTDRTFRDKTTFLKKFKVHYVSKVKIEILAQN